MSHMTLTTGYDVDQESTENADHAMRYGYDMLVAAREQLLTSARPRLLRLARKQGVASDDADDVVQETLVEAWKHLDRLRDPERFDAWLNGICRNVCLRWSRTHSITARRETNLSALTSSAQQDAEEDGFLAGIIDPQIIDPAEELSRQDLAALLDRAMSRLSESHRELLELCYLAEMPQREAALRLGLTISALESRLHRARRQLHQILNGALRAEAEMFGLAFALGEESGGWRESREWCMFCGRHRLAGLIEQTPTGSFSLRMRCPDCGEVIHSGPDILRRAYHSFRPALKQMRQAATDYFMQGLAGGGWQSCMICGTRRRIEIASASHELLSSCPHPRSGLALLLFCPQCQTLTDCYLAGVACYAHPAALRFIEQHPRWITEPETYVTYQGEQAIHLRLIDIASAAQLTLLVHPRTLEVLTTF